MINRESIKVALKVISDRDCLLTETDYFNLGYSYEDIIKWRNCGYKPTITQLKYLAESILLEAFLLFGDL